MKRAFDIIVSSLGLLVAAPLFLAIAVIIRLESRGPVFYKCQRAGRHGRPFGMLKFRTMVDNADNIDCKICSTGDVRVTRFGGILRRTKLNELPQLINVLIGDMSLVGPRPEDPKFLKYYTDQWDVVLGATPGIVGINQIINRNEEELFEPCVDREQFYITKILPEKLKRDMEYVTNRTFLQDLELLIKGVWTSVVHAINREHLRKGLNLLALVLIDAVIGWFSYITAEYLRFESLFPGGIGWNYLLLIMLINPTTFLLSGVYRLSDRFFSVSDYLRLLKVVTLSTILLAILSRFLIGPGHSRLVFFSYGILLMGGIAGRRLAVRLFYEYLERRRQVSQIASKTVIYGAGRIGVSTLNNLKFEPGIELIGFVDDDASLKGRSVLGIKVLGTGGDLGFLKRLHGIEKVVIAFKALDSGSLSAARLRCLEAGIQEISFHNAAPDFSSKIAGLDHSSLDDLASRKNVSTRKSRQRPLSEGATVAIVGGGDRLGESLCSELISMNVARIFVLENCQARLRRISDFMLSLKSSKISLMADFYSPAMNAHIERALISHDVKWIIYNRPNDSETDPANRVRRRNLTIFLQLVRFASMAARANCEYFTLLSPYNHDCFSVPEKQILALNENYVATKIRSGHSKPRFTVIRLPNIIDNDNGIFLQKYYKAISGVRVSVPPHRMEFSTARRSARFIAGSLPQHGTSDILVEKPSTVKDLYSLAMEYAETAGMESTVAHWMKRDPNVEENKKATIRATHHVGSADEPFFRVPVLDTPDWQVMQSCLKASDGVMSAQEGIELERMLSSPLNYSAVTTGKERS